MSDDRFDVIVKSGGGTVVMLRAADLKTATERAKHVAKTERRSAFVVNQNTGAKQEFKPPVPTGENYRRAVEAHARGQLASVHDQTPGGTGYAAEVTEADGSGELITRTLDVSRDEAVELLKLDGVDWLGNESADPRR